MIANLDGTDRGPYTSEYSIDNRNHNMNYIGRSSWQKKIISSSGNNMLIEFKSDAVNEEIGFSASIHYLALPSKECESGLDMTIKIIQSPNYPNIYNNNLFCKWLISVPHDSHITLKFSQFDVKSSFTLFSYFFHKHINNFSATA